MKTSFVRLAILFSACTSISTWAQSDQAGRGLPVLPYHEVLATQIGPGPSYASPPPNMNINHLDLDKMSSVVPDCDRIVARPGVCPEDTVFVCSRHFRTAVCLDRFMLEDPETGGVLGNTNEADCRARCNAVGKRLPTNNEWLVGCTGTVASDCLAPLHEIYWPAGKYAHTPGHPCYGADVHGPNQECMMWPGFIAEAPPVKASCVSEAGVYGCVGSFEQWVSTRAPNGHGKFNGGFYGHSGSSVLYTTMGHTADYRHFGSTCRCAKDPLIN